MERPLSALHFQQAMTILLVFLFLALIMLGGFLKQTVSMPPLRPLRLDIPESLIK